MMRCKSARRIRAAEGTEELLLSPPLRVSFCDQRINDLVGSSRGWGTKAVQPLVVMRRASRRGWRRHPLAGRRHLHIRMRPALWQRRESKAKLLQVLLLNRMWRNTL